MCARIAQMILAALFVYIVISVAAFVYMEWWQAILVSLGTFLLMVFAARLLIKSAIGQIGNLAKEMFRTKSRVLEGATVEVHSVKPTPAPPELLQELRAELAEAADEEDPDEDDEPAESPAEKFDKMIHNSNWYEIEVTIFPKPESAGPMTHWDVDDLRLVSIDAKAVELFDGAEAEDDSMNEFPLYHLKLVSDGFHSEPDQPKFLGPQRLQFVTRVDKSVRAIKFRYYFEDFGNIPLPQRSF